jgi:hypothetical protein
MEKIEVRNTKDGMGNGLFAMEDIEKDDYVMSTWGKSNTNKGRTIT